MRLVSHPRHARGPWVSLAAGLLVAGCASTIPETPDGAPAGRVVDAASDGPGDARDADPGVIAVDAAVGRDAAPPVDEGPVLDRGGFEPDAAEARDAWHPPREDMEPGPTDPGPWDRGPMDRDAAPDAVDMSPPAPDVGARDAAVVEDAVAQPEPLDCVELTHLRAETAELPFPLSSASPRTHFLLTDERPLEDGERLYFWADHQLAGATIAQQFTVILWTLNSDNCSLDLRRDLDPEALVPGPLVDRTGADPVVVQPAAYGGGNPGDPRAHGVNVWDVTDVAPADRDCAPSVWESVDYTARGRPFTLVWQYGGFGAQVYAFRLYHGRPAPCP